MNVHEEWLKLADEDFGAAQSLIDGENNFFGIACFHAQQACEKYLKAYLVFKGIVFPKTHDLEYLLEIIENTNKTLADTLQGITILNRYAVRIRYPGEYVEISKEAALNALCLAKATKIAIENALGNGCF
jgi:HEPN domain-containing protein